ncbi:unnamed protein product [Caenorhabditis brenneri]
MNIHRTFLLSSLFFVAFGQQDGAEGEPQIAVPIVPGIHPIVAVNFPDETIDLLVEIVVPIVPRIRPVAAIKVTNTMNG